MEQIQHESARRDKGGASTMHESQESLRALAKRDGINQKTVAKWRKKRPRVDLVSAHVRPLADIHDPLLPHSPQGRSEMLAAPAFLTQNAGRISRLKEGVGRRDAVNQQASHIRPQICCPYQRPVFSSRPYTSGHCAGVASRADRLPIP